MHWWRWTDGEGGYCLRLSAEDIQARKDTEYALLETVAELRRAQALQEHYLLRGSEERQRLSALLNLIRLGILFIDRDRRLLYCNRAALEIWRYPPGTNLVGTRDEVMQQTVLPLLEEGEAYVRHVETVVSSHQQQSEPYELHFRDGRIVTARSAVVEGRQQAQGIGRVWIYEDVTESRRVAAQLVSLAERDPLTNLYNRRRFHEELERFIAEAARRGVEVGLLMFDLDGFKPINDEFGHQAGDEVLVGLADGVGRLIRRNEMFFRLGGDEFGVLVQDADEHGLTELANRLMYGVAAQRFRFGGHGVGVTASIGIARFPTNARDSESLIAAADEAMYAAKGGGRNRWALSARQAGESARMRARDSDEPTSTEDE
jgi:diguanylate cyclase (GGDEF)-like protein